jgi:hypothetical protein
MVGHHEEVNAPWDVLVPTIGGILAAMIGGTVGGWLGHRSQSTQWAKNARMNAYVEFMRSYAQVYHDLSTSPVGEDRRTVDWSDWNRTLAVVAIIGTAPVARAVTSIDEAMWRFSTRAAQGRLSMQEWTAMRDPLERAVLEFVNLARADLGGLGPELVRLTGRPPATDPVWTPPAVPSGSRTNHSIPTR